MRKRKRLFYLFCLPVFIISCDLLRTSPYGVEAWTPGDGFHGNPLTVKVSLLFSHESDRAITEQAFTFTEDRQTLKGDFLWEGSRLVFIPASPLEKDRDYSISLGTGAQDTKGVSLEKRFEASFTTRPPGGKPRITGTRPEYMGVLSGGREEVCLFFSEPVRPGSCMDHISFSPSTPGSWRLEDENRTALFIPREPWQAGGLYRIRVDSDFAGVSGSTLGEEYSTVFCIGEDRDKPALLKALALLPEGGEEEIPLGSSGYSAWESSTRLCLVFSEPVDTGALRNLLIVEPALVLVAESPPLMSERVVFSFSGYPEWGASFLFRLYPGVKDRAGNESDTEYDFRIRTSGPLSKPPALAGIRLPMAPGNSDDPEALSFSQADLFADLPIKSGEGKYPFAEKTSSWIELYFEIAPDTDIDLFSVMDLFRVEPTNQALDFSPRSIRVEDFSLTDPRSGWETFRRVEIRGVLTNSVHSGLVTFRIPPGLRDKRGNRSAADFRISLLK